jgi:structural maintenance of chromosome 3 (chondroitin sulfate proteoglycan 6)
MYIKFVRIQGFKSYRDKVVCGPLSPMHNSIVGMNGSGKSNFFAALRFVLSDAYSNMRAEERAKLLNEGAGPSLVSAYVEIVFDNSDHRLDNDKEEVTIRRQIGLKKDEYFIDNKHVTKQDISNMLETAGFSKSNPYYIVEQGKVTKITEMADKARLELLKEVAGTNVYEEKKEESLKIMKESDAKMVEIKKNLQMIEERLAKLDAEKEELSQYYLLDKERRSLQHSLFSQKIKGLHEELTGIEHDRQSIKTNSTQSEQDKQRLESQIQDLERQLETLTMAEERLTIEKGNLEDDEKLKLKEQHKQTLKVSERQSKVSSDRKEYETKLARKSKIEGQIVTTRNALTKLEPSIASTAAQAEELSQDFSVTERELNNLSAIRGNAQQFKSKAERDTFLKAEVKSLDSDIALRVKEEGRLVSDIKNAEKQVQELTSTKEDIHSNARKFKENRSKDSEKRKDLDAKRLDLTKQMQTLRAELNTIQKDKEIHEGNLKSFSNLLSNSMQPPAAKALRFLKQFVKKNSIQGFYGPVIDLIDCAEMYNTAIEQSASARLFNIVVEDDTVASTLMNALQQAKEGRTQFLPLSRMKPDVPNLPTRAGAQPLISCLRFDAKFKPAMLEIFGKTLLCENGDVAAECRRTFDVACMTLDGDKFSKKGSIKGGFHDVTKSQILLQKQIRKEEAALHSLHENEGRCKERLRAAEQKDVSFVSDFDKLKSDMENAFSMDARDRGRLESLRKEISDAEDVVKDKNAQLQRVQDDRLHLENRCAGLKEQLSSPFAQALTAEQEAKMKRLTEHHTKLQKQLNTVQSELSTKNAEYQGLERTLKSSTDSLEALQEGIDRLMDTAKEDLEVEQSALSSLERQAQEAKELKEQKEAELEANKQQIIDVNKKLKKVKDELKKFGSDVDSARKKLDVLQERKNRLITEMDGAQAQLRELGSLPEAFEKYKGKNHKQLVDDLHKVTEKLKAFKDVNKKALDQFNQFTEQREKFRERRDELERGADSIRELITKLDEKKDEAIQNTFRMVARNFREVFKLLVPGGSGELIMKTADRGEDREEDEDDGDEDDEAPAARQAGKLRTYVGVSVKVRFAAGGEVRVMRGLSGGQKTVVALGIIFAIQKCDPAPFYLFDEVDANLDPMYRAALASMISKQKSVEDANVQFITSSFQPELAQAADSHWLTTHSGMSRIVKGTIEDQLAIIKENQRSLTTPQAT